MSAGCKNLKGSQKIPYLFVCSLFELSDFEYVVQIRKSFAVNAMEEIFQQIKLSQRKKQEEKEKEKERKK